MEKKDEEKRRAALLEAERKKTVHWNLSDLDREFLRSCNISPV